MTLTSRGRLAGEPLRMHHGDVHVRPSDVEQEGLLRLGFGRIVVSEIEAPNILVNMV